ncbi:hypothetical protein [Massilia niabensis]|uniref:Glycosyltransferase RgtA/B/C/D-like domain-containing protein n=1 Tax=Massilia niabensis TaxID=544910 RepID=A0ABW0L1S7_9BURK
MLLTAATLLTKTRLAFVALFVVLAVVLPLTDPDYFWHLKAGEYIVTHRALPAGDIFSFTRAGQPWVLHEWLFEVMLFGAFATWGPAGVKLLAAFLAVATLGVTFALTRRMGRSAFVACALALCGGFVFASGWNPRPQIVTYLFFSVFLSVLLHDKYYGARRALFVLPLLMVVWVNVHGGYVIGIALTFLFTGAEWLNYWFAATHARDPVQKQRLVQLTRIATATLLASLVNPEFIGHWWYPFQVLGMEANRSIQEWQSPDFHGTVAKVYLLLCGLFLLSYIYATPRADITELLVPGFFLFNGFVSVRHVPLAVLTVMPFIALALARGSTAACAARWQGSWLGRRYASTAGSGRQLGRAAEGLLNWIVLAAIVILLSLYQPRLHAKQARQAERLPAAAADYVIANRIGGNMFNAYDDGGYLIYRLGPEHKVCIDGRVDVYGDEFFKDHQAMYSGAADWKEKFDRLAIDFAILDNDAPIRQLLLAEGSFREAFRDKRHSVLLRSVPRQAALSGRPGHQE